MDMQAGDSELAKQAADGDSAAFRLLLERHYEAILRICYRFLGTREDAEDLTQEICVAMARKIRGFRGDSRFTTWLYRVVVNHCHDHRRREQASRKRESEYFETEKLVRAAASEQAEDLAWLYQALEYVGEDLRSTALLILGEELNHAQAATILGVKESTVSWRMHQLRKRLSEIAGAHE